MGAYLSSPITEKVRFRHNFCGCYARKSRVVTSQPCVQETQEGENSWFRYGVAAMQGWRVTMVCYPQIHGI